MYFFTGDEHYGHKNIIKYCNRPFVSVEQMNCTILQRHNKVVTKNDVVIHAGDFTLKSKTIAGEFISKLNGTHIFLGGSHDKWLGKNVKTRWEKTIEGQHVVVDHYAYRTWAQSYYSSWMLHGHSHGKLKPIGLQYDVGVDNNDFYPISFEGLKIHFKNLLETREAGKDAGLYDNLTYDYLNNTIKECNEE